jgi:hypothetical protein
MLASTLHWKPIVNGYSGFIPPTYYEIARNLQEIPGEKDLAYLRGIGVNTVVLHRDRIPQLLHEYQTGNYGNTGKEVDFGDITILQLKVMSFKEGNDTIRITMPGSMMAGEVMTVKGEVEGPFRFSGSYPQILFTFIPKHPGKTITVKKRVPLPLYVPEGGTHTFGIPLDPDWHAGEYTVASGCDFKKYTLQLSGSQVKVLEFQPLSNNSPGKLKAALSVPEKSMRVSPGEARTVVVKASNTGEAVWLSSARNGQGNVSVGYRIFNERRQEIAGGRSPIPYDLSPGESTLINLVFQAPADKGHYTLQLDMVSEYVTWFEQQGSEPVYKEITVKE